MAASESAKIIPFPGVTLPELQVLAERQPLCGDCEHAAFGSAGVFCIKYREAIWDEKIAEECEEYQPSG